MTLSLIFVFALGLGVGSFLNAVIYRLALAEGLVPKVRDRGIQVPTSPFRGRSYCPQCKHKLSWQDLIPVASFVMLGGKCRYCASRISLQYPLVELGSAMLFLQIFNFEFLISKQFSNFLIFETLYLFAIASLLIVLFVYDLRHYILPDRILFPAIGIVLGYRILEFLNFGNWDLFGIWDLGFGILPALAFLAIVLLSKGTWMGMGDVKLAVFMGLFLGWPNILVALFAAFLVGAVVGVALIALKKKQMKSEVSFGSFLIGGTFAALFFGERLVDYYLDLAMI